MSTTASSVLESVRADDFVEYFLFPPIDATDEKDQELLLNKYLVQANKIIETHSGDYLWHKDDFRLACRTPATTLLIAEHTEPLPAHLHGITHFGDCIEDEWRIVALLQQLTTEIKGLIARVHDSDGEFLLIEAAHHLPAWANPDSCARRVFLHQGVLHLLPAAAESTSNAVSIVRQGLHVAPAAIQAAIRAKVAQQSGAHVHRTVAFVPVGVAAILRHKPALVAAAVRAFCARDPIDARACRAMRYFPPERRVNAQVVMTRRLYAMLANARYVPDGRTGWGKGAGGLAHDLGVKIASGFEILAAQARPSQGVEGDRAWGEYLAALEAKGYFRGLMEHSRDYNDLLNKAKEYYLNYRDSMHSTPLIGQEVLDLSRNLDYKTDELDQIASNLRPEDADSDAWLHPTPEQLDELLEERYGRPQPARFDSNSNPSAFTRQLTDFLEHETDVEGVEHPAPKPAINFDPDGFSCAVQNILNFVIPDDDDWGTDSDSEMGAEEEGGMEAYMAEMDAQLAGTTLAESFERKNGDGFDDIESFQPVDIDVNALKNILESYKAQLGEAGPSSNMLGPMGVHLSADETN